MKKAMKKAAITKAQALIERDRQQFMKGVATSAAIVLAGARKAKRTTIIDALHNKVKRSGVSKEALNTAIEAAEKASNRVRKPKAA